MYSGLLKQSEMEFDYELSGIQLDEEDRLYFVNKYTGTKSNKI